MAEARRRLCCARGTRRRASRRPPAATVAAADQRQARSRNRMHDLDVAAVMRTEREDAGRDAVLERRARRRDVARGQRRRRRDAVVERRHEDRVQHPADRRRRQLAHQQQIDGVGERQPAHHLVERVAADQDRVRRDRGQRRLPAVARRSRGCARRSFGVCIAWSRGIGALQRAITACRTADRRSRRGRGRCTCARSARGRRPACRSARRDDAARRPRCLPARRRCRRCGCRARRPRVSRSSAATALPPVASIGSIISTKLSARFGGQLRVVLRRHRRRLVALQPDVADARVRHELEHGVEHAEAGAQHRHDDDVGARRRPGAGPSGVSTVTVAVGDVAQRLGRRAAR